MWLIVGGEKEQDILREGDRGPHSGIRRNVQGPDSRNKTGAQVQETNEGVIDSTNMDSEDTRKS